MATFAAVEIWMGFSTYTRCAFVFVLLATGCKSEDPSAKIGFDLEILNEEGLYGPPDGLRSIDYEFCIPAGKYVRDEVMSIDPTAQCSPGKGRVGCRSTEFLCVGNTHQARHNEILRSLARLRYVQRIEESLFE